jgi:DNA-binding MarR family transcriptional regulator
MPERPRRSPPRVDEYLRSAGWLLNKAAAQVTDALEDALSPYGLRARSLGVLALLDQEPQLTQGRVGASLRIDRSQMVLVVDDLERSGYVQRTRNVEDRRSYHLSLTPEGRQILHDTLIGIFVSTEEAALAPLTKAERRELNRLLTELIREQS